VRLSAIRRFNCAYGARFCACRQVRSRQYGRLSAPIHQPQAARAVGSAVGANPIAFIIPCRRVIRETGVLGNYRWDPLRKRAIIGWEAAMLEFDGEAVSKVA
jgi:O-6-methylguanine DNA methyltransferase